MAERQVKSREAKVDLDEDVLEVIAQGPAPDPGPSDEKPDFDDDTLKAIAEVYQEEGDKELTRKEVCNAIYFYTEGIQVNCKDVQVNAKLYSNRATAYYHLGNYQEALNDATAAVNLEPTLIKAIETGASACEQLQCYEDAILWCEKGLANDKTNKTLLDLRARCVGDRNELQEAKSNAETHPVKGQSVMAESEIESREAKVDFDKDVLEVIVQGPVTGPGPSDEKLDFDDDTVRAIAEVYSNRATAYYRLGNFHEALNDATTAVKLEPTLMKAIKTGASACEQLHCYEDAILWCEKGLAIDKTNKTFLILRARCVGHRNKLQEAKSNPETHPVNGQKNTNVLPKTTEDVEDKTQAEPGKNYDSLTNLEREIECHASCLKIAKEVGHKTGEEASYCNLGNACQSLEDFKKAIEYHKRQIKIAKESGDRQGEGRSYGNLGNAYYRLGDFKTAIKYHEPQLKIAKEVRDRPGEGRAYSNLGEAYYRLGDFKKTIEYLERHLKIAKEVGDRAEEGRSYGNLGAAHDRLGDFNKAIEYHERHLKVAKELGDRPGEGRSYGNLGNGYQSLGDFRKAIEYHERHLKIVKEVGQRPGEGGSYGNLGNAYYRLGDFRKAIEYFKLDLKIVKEVEDRAGEGSLYNNLGNAYHHLGDFKKAMEYYELDLKTAKEVGDRPGEGRSYGNLGNGYQSLGDFKKAIEYHERYLKIAKELGDRPGEGRSYGSLGNAYYSLGDFRKAIKYFERHQKIAKEVGDRAGEESLYGNLGTAYQGLGDFKKAIEYHERRLKVAKEVGDRPGEGDSYGNLGIAYYSLGDFKKAIEYHKLDQKIAKEVGDRAGEGSSYGNLGNAYQSLGDFEKAIEYCERSLKIVKEVGARAGEGGSCGNLGNAYFRLGDFKTAIEYHERHLKIAQEVGDKPGEGRSYGNLGIAYQCLGDFERAIQCFERHLKIAKEIEDRVGEGGSYGNLGNTYHRLGDCRKAIEYHELDLKIAKEVGDRAGEGRSYANLGNAYLSLGDFKKAIEYLERHLKIAKEVGDRAGEGISYGYLGIAYASLGDFKKAIEYQERHLKIAKEVGDRAGEGEAYYGLGNVFESQGSQLRALECYNSSVRLFNDVRQQLQGKDEWCVSYRNLKDLAYTRLWRLMLKQGNEIEALFAVEEGRAQALKDLLNSKYETETPHIMDKMTWETLSCLPLNTVFMAVHEREIIFWIIQNGKDVQLRRKEIRHNNSKDSATAVLELLNHNVHEEIGVRGGLKCEDRSLDRGSEIEPTKKKSYQTLSQSTLIDSNALRTWYDITISPIKDLINGSELLFVPEGQLCLASYAAFMDSNSKYLSESFGIRVIPSLNSLKLIKDCSPNYHKKFGALLVGDPCLEEVRPVSILEQLPCAKKEVEMIGKILNTAPLTGKEATKDEVLRRLSTVALVHIAAHGRMETGEIALAPNPIRDSQIPIEEDFLLTMSDVMRVQMRARLVVLSCCHSGRGEVKAEGVVGIARAFLGAGARSVLVSLWAIDDEATLEFMKSFYLHLAEGRSSSESLNCAMRCFRESEKFSEVKYWAPFVLIGDDVTLDLAKGD